MRRVAAIALPGLLLIGFAWRASAQAPVVLHDTFPFDGPSSKNRLVGCFGTVPNPCDNATQDASFQWADWFQVSGGDYTLDTVSLRFTSSGGNILVRLWDDAGGVPGSVLEELPAIPGPFSVPLGVIKETASVTEPLLEEGGVYWISVAMENPLQSAAWRKADLLTAPGPLVSDELVFANANDEVTPGEWTLVGSDTGDIDGDGDQDPLPGAFFGVMKITAIPAPEPGVLLAQSAALAVVGLLVRGRRRTRR
jgi:hypothetical protein